MPDEAVSRAHAVVRGFVQGVGYRYFVMRRARSARLQGWVRNNPDGSVECLLQGPRGKVEEMLGELRRGPAGAQVSQLEVDWEEPAADLDDFDVDL